MKHGLLWHHYSVVHGDVEVGKISCFFLSPSTSPGAVSSSSGAADKPRDQHVQGLGPTSSATLSRKLLLAQDINS